jgi:hypothetical protein
MSARRGPSLAPEHLNDYALPASGAGTAFTA